MVGEDEDVLKSSKTVVTGWNGSSVIRWSLYFHLLKTLIMGMTVFQYVVAERETCDGDETYISTQL